MILRRTALLAVTFFAATLLSGCVSIVSHTEEDKGVRSTEKHFRIIPFLNIESTSETQIAPAKCKGCLKAKTSGCKAKKAAVAKTKVSRISSVTAAERRKRR